MKWHIYVMLISVAISAVGLGLIAAQTDPYTTSSVLRLLFFAALTVFLWGLVSLVTLYFRYRFGKRKVNERILVSSYLIGFLVSILTLGFIVFNIWI